MFSLATLKLYSIRHAFAFGLAVFVAVWVNQFYAFSNEFWITLTAFLVSQTTLGTPLKQGFNLLLIILFAILLSSFLLFYIHSIEIIYTLLAISFVIFAYVILSNRFLMMSSLNLLLSFLFVFLIATLSPIQSTHFIENRVIDVLIGGGIGLISMCIVSYVQFDKEFRLGLAPLLRLLKTYNLELQQLLLAENNQVETLLNAKIVVQNALHSQESAYPEWVYEVGFNRGLRAGFRFYLITLERVVELFIAMNFLLTNKMKAFQSDDHDKSLQKAIIQVMQNNAELLEILIQYFAQNKVGEIKADFTSDIESLENALRAVVPDSLELLDISPDYLVLTIFVRDIKDVRRLLLQLVMALPVV